MPPFPHYKLQNPQMLPMPSLAFPPPPNLPLNTTNFQAMNANLQASSETSHEMKQTEDFLAAEFNQLSVEEQTKALNDIYGVGEDLKESQGLIDRSLAEFEEQLQTGRFPIYRTALSRNRAYVEDETFRLKFLRANMYNVTRSVTQMLSFLAHKAKYFGVDKIARDITLEDLNQEDMDLMLSGFYHIQDGTDQGGRVIVYMFNHMLGKCKAETLIRVNYYIWFNILSSLPVVQKKGLVTVYWDLTRAGEAVALPELQWLLSVFDYFQSVPVRCSASHICAKTGTGSAMLNNFVLGVALKAMPAYSRARARLHRGSDMDLQFQLQRHGFPATCPVDSNGNLRRGILNVWFHLHMANEASCIKTFNRFVVMEESEDSSAAINIDLSDQDEEEDTVVMDTVAHPAAHAWGYIGNGLIPQVSSLSGSSSRTSSTQGTTNDDGSKPSEQANAQRISPDHNEKDVLLGRGRDIQNHTGNIRFREFLTAHQDQYDDAPRNQRRMIATNLYNLLKAAGIRFWQKSTAGEWEEIGSLEGEKKIGQLFRTRRKRK